MTYVDSPFGSLPEIWTGAEVAADNINAAGGVNGRPIKVIRCNSKADAKAEEACARKAVGDGAIASVSNVFQVNPQGALEILDRGGVTDIAGAGSHPALYSLPSMYPIEFLAASENVCVSSQATATAGDDAKIGVVVGQNPFAEGIFALMEPFLKSDAEAKGKYVGSVSVPATQQDYTPIVQKLADKGANYIVTDIDPASASQVVTTAGAAGKKWTFCGDAGLFGPSLLKKLAPVTKSFLTVTYLPPASSADTYPLVKQFIDEMKTAQKAGKSNADISTNFINSFRAWVGMQIFKDVASSINGEVTTSSFAEAMKTAKVDLGFAQIDFSKPLGTPPYQRVFQPNNFILKWNPDTEGLDQVAQVNLLDLLAK